MIEDKPQFTSTIENLKNSVENNFLPRSNKNHAEIDEIVPDDDPT